MGEAMKLSKLAFLDGCATSSDMQKTRLQRAKRPDCELQTSVNPDIYLAVESTWRFAVPCIALRNIATEDRRHGSNRCNPYAHLTPVARNAVWHLTAQACTSWTRYAS